MKIVRCLLLSAFTILLFASGAAAEDWNNVTVVDVMCAAKAKDAPDAHTRACALQCEKSGFAIVTAAGEVIHLDDAGNQQVVAALKQSKQRDRLRVHVSGERAGDRIKVRKLTLV